MKITLEMVAENGNSVSSAIEAACKDHDSIASGVIGPSFACSGPGSGWQRNYDVGDYAKAALSGDYGASSYIDSYDGREATLSDGEELEWSDESVIELVCPSLEDALENQTAVDAMLDALTIHSAMTDQDAWDALEEKMQKPYEIRDSSGEFLYVESLETLAEVASEWYDHLTEQGKLDTLPASDLDPTSLRALVKSVTAWENRIGEAMGHKAFHGHGSYGVSAASEAGLSLTIGFRD